MFVNIKMNLCAEQKFLIKWKAKSRVETIKTPGQTGRNHRECELEQRAYIFEAMFEQPEPNLFAYLMLVQWASANCEAQRRILTKQLTNNWPIGSGAASYNHVLHRSNPNMPDHGSHYPCKFARACRWLQARWVMKSRSVECVYFNEYSTN